VVLTLGADGTPWSAAAYANLAESVDALGILQTFGRAQERGVLLAENEALRARLSQANPLDSFHSSDPRMQAVLETARAIANTRATVLLLGESGTGKSRLARCLHATSDRRSGPFQVVHCGALPSALLESELFGHAKGAFTGAIRDRAGRFEEADGGTIFLDEIQSAPLELQVKLLRVLQDREFERVGETRTRQVDVRILAASNQDLLAAIDRGEFREDLYWRLNVVSLTLPPLRERPADVLRLTETFLRRFAREYRRTVPILGPEVPECLAAYSWPGNLRQLENVVERALLVCQGTTLHREHLPEEVRAEGRLGSLVHPGSLVAGLSHLQEILPLKQALIAPERAILIHALESTRGNRSEAAERLGINRTTLFNKMRKHGLMHRSFEGSNPDS